VWRKPGQKANDLLMGEAATRFSDLTIITSDNPRQEDPMDIISEIETGIDGREVKKNEPDNLKLNEGGRIYTVIPERKRLLRPLSMLLVKRTSF